MHKPDSASDAAGKQSGGPLPVSMRFRSSPRRTSEFPAPCSRYRSVLLPLLALVTVTMAGCDSKTTSEVTTAPTPAKCQLTVAGPPNVVADGGTGTISVTAQPECAWTVSTQASWLSQFSPASGQGNGTVAFRAEPNPAPSTREAEIVVNDSQLRVMQEAAPCRFSLAPETQSVAASASNVSVSISVLNGCAWTARSNAEWLHDYVSGRRQRQRHVDVPCGSQRWRTTNRNVDHRRSHAHSQPAAGWGESANSGSGTTSTGTTTGTTCASSAAGADVHLRDQPRQS